jgi:hypothetical protein
VRFSLKEYYSLRPHELSPCKTDCPKGAVKKRRFISSADVTAIVSPRFSSHIDFLAIQMVWGLN